MGDSSAFRRLAARLPVRVASISLIEILGAAIAIGVLLYFNRLTMNMMDEPLFVAPLAASIAIIFIQPGMSVARSWNVIAGQFLSACVGLACVKMLDGQLEIAAMVALALALVVMRCCHCLHPPACATALIIVVTPPLQHAGFLLFPVLLGAIAIVLIAWGVHLLEERLPPGWYGRRPLPPA